MERQAEDINGSHRQVRTAPVSISKIAGRLAKFLTKWQEITSDQWVLDAVTNYHIEFFERPVQVVPPKPNLFSPKETAIISAEIEILLQKGAIQKVTHVPGEFISSIFIRPKKDGSFRPIINLRNLNKSVAYFHFKMETIHLALQLIRPQCFMASLDLKDAYFAIPIAMDHRKYLRFAWLNNLFEFTCLPFGLACAPRVFTKVMKPLIATLRQMGHESCDYIDDSLLLGSTAEECKSNVAARLALTQELGFIVNSQKSVLEPTQCIAFLGFILNSVKMTIEIPVPKVANIELAILNIVKARNPKIREVAHVIGLLVSCELAVPYGALFRRAVELEKTLALAENSNNFEARMFLSERAKAGLNWWHANLRHSSAPIHRPKPDFIVESDASNLGWGAHCNGQILGGKCLPTEASLHINYLELKACFFALKSLFSHRRNIHIHLKSDNTTVVSYIQFYGGSHSAQLNELAREIWLWCLAREIWLSVSYLPGADNVNADYASRHFHEDMEWKLEPEVFRKVTDKFMTPNIDMFASRLNWQIQPYVSWQPDPGALHNDAFTLDWSNYEVYAFPPFCLIGKVLTKIEYDESVTILIAPLWQTQVWFPKMLKLLVNTPVILPQRADLLSLPSSGKLHPWQERLQLMACHLSGKNSDVREFRKKLPTLSWHPGGPQPKRFTEQQSINGFYSVLGRKLILFEQL